jgi:phosphate-selective porin OprO/OprP
MSKSMLRLSASVLVLGFAAAFASPAFAGQKEDLKAQIEALKKQIAEQQKQLEVLSVQVQDVKESSANQFVETQRLAAEKPTLGIKNGRPTFESSDGKFSAQVRALGQLDWGYYSQDGSARSLPAAYGPDLSSGANFRRVYLGVQGKLFGDWSYNFNYDFGGGGAESPGRIQSVYLQYDGLKPWAIRAGAFPPPANLEDSTGPGDTIFLERNAPSDLQRGIAGGDGRDAISVIYGGDALFAALSYTGAKVQDSPVFDEQQALLGRASYMFYSDADAHFLVGANGTYVFKLPDAVANGTPTLDTTPGATALNSITLSDPPEITIDSNGIRLTNTGALPADEVGQWGVETAGNWANFYAQAGYYDFEVTRSPVAHKVFTSPVASVTQIVQPGDNSFDAWYVQATWVLTGESRTYNAASGAFTPPKPAKPFALDGFGWGAWELAARYSELDLNDRINDPASVITAWTAPTTRTYTFYNTVRGGDQKALTLALNWYANDNIRFGLHYQLIDLDRLQSGATPNAITGITTTTTGVPAIPTVSADQTVQTIALRAQFGF